MKHKLGVVIHNPNFIFLVSNSGDEGIIQNKRALFIALCLYCLDCPLPSSVWSLEFCPCLEVYYWVVGRTKIGRHQLEGDFQLRYEIRNIQENVTHHSHFTLHTSQWPDSRLASVKTIFHTISTVNYDLIKKTRELP